MEEVFRESRKCNVYSYINMPLIDFKECKKGAYVTAFLKNYQRFCIYCSLNLGCSGIVLDQQSLVFLKNYF